jgi:hypothetical protein
VAVSALTDSELVEELAIAASARGRSRIDRYQALLHESAQRRRRRSITTGDEQNPSHFTSSA